jgi:hypothetical protein
MIVSMPLRRLNGVFLEQPGSSVPALNGGPNRCGALSKNLQAGSHPAQQDDHDAENDDRVAQATQNRGPEVEGICKEGDSLQHLEKYEQFLSHRIRGWPP